MMDSNVQIVVPSREGKELRLERGIVGLLA